MAQRPRVRRYDDPCGIARALDLIGERWALLVVRELIHGPKRFSDLRTGLGGVSPNVLSQRLRDLSERRIVRQRHLGPPVSSDVYELTVLGNELEPVLLALARWGSRAVGPSGGELSDDAFVIALRTTISPACPEGRFGLDVGSDRFTLEVAGGSLSSRRGMLDSTDAIIGGSVAHLRQVTFGGRPVAEAVAAGDITITGDAAAAIAFLGSFVRPTVIEA